MESVQFPELIQQWANDILVWIGFGTVVGLLAKGIMPGRTRAVRSPRFSWESAGR